MNLQKTYLILALLAAGVSAAPRGAGRNEGGIRGREERKLQMDDAMDAMDAGDGGDDTGDGGSTTTGISEWHGCEANPAKAIEYVDYMGQKDLGSLECYADPINGCSGGCCRFGAYFICDTENFAPHLACVCNENTQPAPGGGSVTTPATTPTVTMGTGTPGSSFPVTMPPAAAAPVTVPTAAAAGTQGGTFAPIPGFSNVTGFPVTPTVTLAPVALGTAAPAVP
jgi:hypothetical protein